MCNIAGYVGTREAAPILWKMIMAESGFGGGYYSGIATIADGTLHSAKVLGDFDRLAERFPESLKFPGTTGIAHSRSKSGGGDSWAHPFVSNDNTLAYVANGACGTYGTHRDPDARGKAARMLEAEGVRFDSASDPVPGYVQLSNGQGVHDSEVMCHLIHKYLRECGDPEEAMRRAYENSPAEIVGLVISSEHPDTIYAARFNQPMMIGQAEDGIYLATTAIAFPDDVEFTSITLLPAGCSATITPKSVTLHTMNMALPVKDLDADILYRVRKAAEAILECGPVNIFPLVSAAQACYNKSDVAPVNVVAYEALRGLLKAGKAELFTVKEPGQIPSLEMTRIMIRKK